MKTLAITILTAILMLIVGLYVGTIKSYEFFSRTIEERVIRDANVELMRIGFRKYELAVEEGAVMAMPRR